VRGGAVPSEFFRAIEKGLRDTMELGVLAGFPVLGVTATLLDGSAHAVDSSDLAFRTAGAAALREALRRGASHLLEPMMKVEIATPDPYIGEIVGYLGAHRGRVLATRRFRKGSQKINALVPLAEMFGFATPLRTMSSGRANFAMEFHSYRQVPAAIQLAVVEQRRKR
jgi:elongation factor G